MCMCICVGMFVCVRKKLWSLTRNIGQTFSRRDVEVDIIAFGDTVAAVREVKVREGGDTDGGIGGDGSEEGW